MTKHQQLQKPVLKKKILKKSINNIHDKIKASSKILLKFNNAKG